MALLSFFIADKVSLATVALGRFLAPHIQKQGTKVLQSGFNLSEEDAKSKVSAYAILRNDNFKSHKSNKKLLKINK